MAEGYLARPALPSEQRADDVVEISGQRGLVGWIRGGGELLDHQPVDGRDEDACSPFGFAGAGSAQDRLGHCAEAVDPRRTRGLQLRSPRRLEVDLELEHHRAVLGDQRAGPKRTARAPQVGVGELLGQCVEAVGLVARNALQGLREELLLGGEVVGRRGEWERRLRGDRPVADPAGAPRAPGCAVRRRRALRAEAGLGVRCCRRGTRRASSQASSAWSQPFWYGCTTADSAAIHAFDGATGEPVPGWPKWTGGWTLWTPAVGDLDGDGRVEVVASLREGVLRAWRTPGRAEANGEAWHWHQNDRNTGLHGEDTRPPAAVRNLRVKREAGRSVVSFRASGDDWNAGRAERFVVYRSTRAIGDDLSRATRVAVVDAAPAGQTQTVVVPRPRSKVVRPFHFAVRGVDDADNIGPLPGAAGAPCLSRRTFTIRLRGRPPGTVRVRITQRVRTAAGRTTTRRSTRSYRLCRTTRAR